MKTIWIGILIATLAFLNIAPVVTSDYTDTDYQWPEFTGTVTPCDTTTARTTTTKTTTSKYSRSISLKVVF